MKKSLIWRGILIAAIVIGWIYSLIPLGDQDFATVFRREAGSRADARLEEMLDEATERARPQRAALTRTARDRGVRLAQVFPTLGSDDDAIVAALAQQAAAYQPEENWLDKVLPSFLSTAKSAEQVYWELAREAATGPAADGFVSAAEQRYSDLKMPVQSAMVEVAAEAAMDDPDVEVGRLLGDYVPLYKKPNPNDREVVEYVHTKARGKLSLGLDLRGGTEFIIGFDPDETDRAAEQVRDEIIEILRNRIDQSGVIQPEIRPIGPNTVSVRVPSTEPKEVIEVRELLRRSAMLTFHEVWDRGGQPDEVKFKPLPVKKSQRRAEGQDTMWVAKIPEKVNGTYLVNAVATLDEVGQYQINFEFNAEGGKLFGETTKKLLDRQMAVVLDDVVYSAPVIQSQIFSRGQITGDFTGQEARQLAIVLRSGNLPVAVNIEGEFATNPTLGIKTVRSGFVAGAVGILLVALFMIVYYRTAGVIANVALFSNVIIIMGTMPIMNATLTLPGLAGLVLTIGMAVDANVLIFERIREELAKPTRAEGGRPVTLKNAVASGYDKAFSTILDANLTTFFTALILMKFGSGPIRGFAVILCVGILASMFTALFMTRWAFDLLIEFNLIRDHHERERGSDSVKVLKPALPMLSFYPPRVKEVEKEGKIVKQTRGAFDFLKFTRKAVVLSAILALVALISFFWRGSDSLSVDFRGGTAVTYTYEQQVPTADMENTLTQAGYQGASVTYKFAVGEAKVVEVVLPTADDAANEDVDVLALASQLNEAFPDANFGQGTTERIGGLVGERFRTQAAYTMVLALFVILIYISFRFEFAYALGAVAALVHDLFICTGLFLLPIFGERQISLTVIAGLLTLIGYSLNDTIVVFDRIREARQLDDKDRPLGELANEAIDDTLSRTILTSGTTLFTVLTLYLFGGGGINDFAFYMLLSILVGTFSSIFVATPVMMYFRSRNAGAQPVESPAKPSPRTA